MNCQLIVTDVTGIGDPFVLNYKGVYYMYATSSKEGFKVWKSHDLKNWKDCGLCYFKQDSFGYMDFWAPEVTVRRDGKLVMHFTAKDNTSNGLRIGVAVADSPLGVFRDVYHGKPMFDLGYSIIDAHCFTDDDGTTVLSPDTIEEAPEPEEGSYYIVDLLGSTVATQEGKVLGVLKDIRQAATDVYTIEREGKEILFPAAKGVILSVDVKAARIVVDGARFAEVSVEQ